MKHKIKNFFTAKVWLTILCLICFGFIGITYFTDVLTTPLTKVTSYLIIPLQKGVNGMGLWLTEKHDLYVSIEELQAENDRLYDEIEKLKEENLMMQNNKIELEELRKLFELDSNYENYNKVCATVIGKSADNWYNTFTIDKGSKDGIEVNMNVIAGNGLVGIVTTVSDNYSIVRAIIDDASNISAMLLNTSDICTVSGNLKTLADGYIEIKYFDSDVTVRDGDMIVTSNISEKYLPGILIGYAHNVTLDSNNLTRSGYLIPAADFKHIRNVLVITDKKIATE